MTLAREGLREMFVSTIVFGGVAAGSAWFAMHTSTWVWPITAIAFALWAFTIAFFRDPKRRIPQGPGLLVSPADGRITEITRLDAYDGIHGPALRIGIFLSVFDVHVNRTPCAGRVTRAEYRPGEFLDARHPECGVRNESNTIYIEPAGLPGPVVVRQIAGLIARRIISHVGPGDTVERGQRFGLIKFGSRTEVIVPADGSLESAVVLDQQVKGGETILLASPLRAESIAVRHGKSNQIEVAAGAR